MTTLLEYEPPKVNYGFAPNTYWDAVRYFFDNVVPGKTDDDCWGWKRSVAHGYAILKFNGRMIRASRLSWELFSGMPIRKGLIMFHKCNNPICCNPRHIWPDTHQRNMDYMRECGRERHPKGDELATKMTSDSVVRMRSDYASGGFSFRTLANKYGVSKTHARYIVSGSKWKSASGTITPLKPQINDEFSALPMSNGLRYYYRRIKKSLPN